MFRRRLLAALLALVILLAGLPPAQPVSAQTPDADWPQLGRDPQHTNFSPQQIDPPYCYTWKWDEVPLASRAQPVVAAGRLFIGSMDGSLYARDASSGAPLWSFASRGPIRHSAAVIGDVVIFSSQDGYTYALHAATGGPLWKTYTGPSATAPLIDEPHRWIYMASEDGILTALEITRGAPLWQFDANAPILTTPALSQDGKTVFAGSEAVQAFALNASDGSLRWRTPLQGQSLADRYPVVSGNTVFYRSQPLYFFHDLLHEGDDVMDQAGPLNPDWEKDWAAVRPKIVQYLRDNPFKQTFFALNSQDGSSLGTPAVLYTYGNNDTPAAPVIRLGDALLPYRARHGIQTDGRSVHVTSKYDAELGLMDLQTLDIRGFRQVNYPSYHNEFRLTSDEPASLTMGGNILFVDNWERLGGFNTKDGSLVHIGNVSNDWPECYAQCGLEGPAPFFPLSGTGAPYPFPEPRVTEGRQRPGAVIANNMIYWRVVEGGLAGIAHRYGSGCPAPKVWATPPTAAAAPSPAPVAPPSPSSSPDPAIRLIESDLNVPAAQPSMDLVDRLRSEVKDLLSTAHGEHLLPFYVQRGFSKPFLWPPDVPPGQEGLPAVTYAGNGTVFWQDPGELLYTLALAYPYLDPSLQALVKTYMQAEMQRFPPLQYLPYNDSQHDWLHNGAAREPYGVPFRKDLSNWPPPATSLVSLYHLWTWSKNTGDWAYPREHWKDATSLFENHRDRPWNYYSDLSGVVGYARMAKQLGDTGAYNRAVIILREMMAVGKDFNHFRDFAAKAYLDPRDVSSGWSAPVFFGLTPEVGAYLRTQTNEQALRTLRDLESGDGVRWWYLTRVGVHAEVGESSFLAPNTAWSHFLAHAYIEGDSQETLRGWLDRPWAPGDLYSIQKLVATLQAPRSGPNLSQVLLSASSYAPLPCQQVSYTLQIDAPTASPTDTVTASLVVPNGEQYISGSLAADQGAVDDSSAPLLKWSGSLGGIGLVTVHYDVQMTAKELQSLTTNVVLDGRQYGIWQRSSRVLANGYLFSLPWILLNREYNLLASPDLWKSCP